MQTFDVIVIGGGIAGASLGYELADHCRVAVLERETAPGYHATGRSAATFSEAYGPDVIRRLSRASRGFFEADPDGFADHPLLTPRSTIIVAEAEERNAVAAELAQAAATGADLQTLSMDDVIAQVPVLRPGVFALAFAEPGFCDLDVAALHQGFLRGLKARGGLMVCNADVAGATRAGDAWAVETRAGRFAAPDVVNAAGAWADEIAGCFGAKPLGLVPKRRSAFTFDPPDGLDIAAWPLLGDLAETFYLKPDAGRIMASPSDATPSPPCDAQPEELDIAVCAHRIEEVTTLTIPRIAHKWAGLRTFAPDGAPVVGPDPAVEGFFWLVGQGGYGIQTAPALSRSAAHLLLHGALPADVTRFGVTVAALSPARFAAPSAA